MKLFGTTDFQEKSRLSFKDEVLNFETWLNLLFINLKKLKYYSTNKSEQINFVVIQKFDSSHFDYT